MKFDMHCHTAEGSMDSNASVIDWSKRLKAKGYAGMLVTDHDSYRGYLHAVEHQDELPQDFLVLKGIEYDTRDAGHFLVIMPDGVNLRLLSVRGMRVEMLTRLVHHYGGILGPAHPYGMQSASSMFFRSMKSHPETLNHFDFIEGFNTCELPSANEKARMLAEEYGLPCIGGSDAHKTEYIGTAYTQFDRKITCNNDLIAAIKEGEITDYGGKERTYLRKHRKRYWMLTTLTLLTLNRGASLLFKPYRKHQATKLGLYEMDANGKKR